MKKNCEIFNEQDLLVFTEGDRFLSSEVIRMGVQDLPDLFEKARLFRKNNQLNHVIRTLHKIKGTAGSLGAVEVRVISTELELTMKNSRSFDIFDREEPLLRNAIDSYNGHDDVTRYLREQNV